MPRQCEMQRRHFEFIAAVIKNLHVEDATRVTVAREFARQLRLTNGQFRSEQFESVGGMVRGMGNPGPRFDFFNVSGPFWA